MPPETLLSMDCVTVLLVWVLEASNPSVVTEPIPALEVTSPFSVTLESGSPVICPVAVTAPCRDTLSPSCTAISLESLKEEVVVRV